MDSEANNQDPVKDNTAEILFFDIFKLSEIQHLQDLFSDATGIASLITHPDGTPITNPSNFCSQKSEQIATPCLKKTVFICYS